MLGLTLPTNGCADAELDVRLFGRKIDSSLLHSMSVVRRQELLNELKAESDAHGSAANGSTCT